YTQYFNRKHVKVGHLFQGRYKAIICAKDEYLLTLVRYIHLNPIRAKIVETLDEYPYSGHRDYAAGRAAYWVRSCFLLFGLKTSVPDEKVLTRLEL
ncbi:MAG: transposase, partial [Gammaproteobacteria bacterium]